VASRLGKNQRFIKLFVVLFFSTAFIFSFSHFGAKAFENLTGADGKFSEGTTVGVVDVSGKTETEAISLLEEKYVDWVKNTKVELQYSEITVPLDVNLFHFDSAQTVTSIKDGQQNPAIVTIDLLQVGEQVQILFPQIDTNILELTKLTADLNKTASQFSNGSFSFNLSTDYLLVDAGNKDAVISEISVELKNMPNDFQSVIEANPEIMIEKENKFSLLEFAANQKIENSSILSIIATGMYQAILPTNFLIDERNISDSLPDYALLGMEAKVNVAKGLDLVVSNPNKAAFKVELKLENKKLFVTLKGEKLLYDYEISQKDKQSLKPKTIVQYSPLVKEGKIQVQTSGVDGSIIKVYRDVYQDNKLIKQELISEDYYPPVYRVEIHGLKGTDPNTVTPDGSTPAVIPDPNAIQTSPIPEGGQQVPENDGLWGKPNEQPK
jgi:hypothetical protein